HPFSVISQPRVHQILNPNPIHPTQIIQQSPPLLKYKKPKPQSLQKLHHTQHNLTPLEHILYHLQPHLQPLTQQTPIPKEYK
ncbi:hypothetical protein, partial [Staphylococcus pasteuri]|uniref:hypothetical protein n=1 Tax=Staphylococcus pasteuri TaxID=45972 RepID=UPI001C993B17